MADVTTGIKKPLGWAKASPWVFALFLLVVVLLTIRFRDAIAAFISKWPVVGKWLTGLTVAKNAPPSTPVGG
jgi:hypothetical protein